MINLEKKVHMAEKFVHNYTRKHFQIKVLRGFHILCKHIFFTPLLPCQDLSELETSPKWWNKTKVLVATPLHIFDKSTIQYIGEAQVIICLIMSKNLSILWWIYIGFHKCIMCALIKYKQYYLSVNLHNRFIASNSKAR